MAIRSVLYTTLIILLTTLAVTANWLWGFITPAKVINPMPLAISSKLLLIPLDSRPPCNQFVIALGRLAGIEIIVPPSALLDNYKQPANQQILRQWLTENIRQVDGAIISADMLIHGGLLASRQSYGTSEDVAQTLSLLVQIRDENPQLPLYVFSIIPRLLLDDTPANSAWQTPMMKYSILKDQLSIFDNPLDGQKLFELEQKISPEIISNYLSLYERNIAINKSLIDLSEQGILTMLTLGQDDGQAFGLPNQAKERLIQYVLSNEVASQRVIITRGTDEVALTLLGRYTNIVRQWHPRIYVIWSHPDVPALVMPYMPHSVSRTVTEKIAMIGAIAVPAAAQADFILYVHAGNHKTGPSQLANTAKEVQHLISEGHQVALVDLAQHYYVSETLLTYLLEANGDLAKLAAYAGWNTTSNSIGTAVTQAALFTGSLRERTDQDQLGLYAIQISFLVNRFLDDWYYQKEIQPAINKQLLAAHINPYHLGEHYAKTNDRISQLVTIGADRFFRQTLANKSLLIGDKEYRIISLTVASSLPWDRTFEIKLTPTLTFVELQKK